jgi:hypothetical protein
VRRNFRTGATHRSSLRFPTRRRFFPDEVAHVRLHDGVHRWSCVDVICARIERHAQCALIPQDLARLRTRAGARFPGRPRPLMSTPRGHIRPDTRGRERPPSEWVRGRLPGVAEGVAHAPSSLSTIIRAASAAAQSAAAFPLAARAHPLVRQRVAASASSENRHHHHLAEPPSSSAARRGTSHTRGVVPPLFPCPPLQGCDKLTLTLTVTRGRAG